MFAFVLWWMVSNHIALFIDLVVVAFVVFWMGWFGKKKRQTKMTKGSLLRISAANSHIAILCFFRRCDLKTFKSHLPENYFTNRTDFFHRPTYLILLLFLNRKQTSSGSSKQKKSFMSQFSKNKTKKLN